MCLSYCARVLLSKIYHKTLHVPEIKVINFFSVLNSGPLNSLKINEVLKLNDVSDTLRLAYNYSSFCFTGRMMNNENYSTVIDYKYCRRWRKKCLKLCLIISKILLFPYKKYVLFSSKNALLYRELSGKDALKSKWNQYFGSW